MSGAHPAIRIHVRGRVQGVGFRAFVERRAQMLGLSGWVRNRADGSVEAVAAGPQESLDDLVAACREGPRAARVSAVEVLAEADAPQTRDFAVRPTL
ncbi:acylphosphatase [Futiania mangrovi]|uniref:Acylphosphatase n=1 Tax=Futiania mangrovi TaxID=2959716 RepID=A0A9J6PGK5_9PROT|nr:acylphosphatase [Futiania mangrovii]MCP1335226.1 acylphosphatase [Futiania mangrovii]